MWIYMPVGYTNDVIPLICNNDNTLCLYLENQLLHGTVGEHTASSATTIPALSWTNVAMRFDAEGLTLHLYLNVKYLCHMWL